jgi:hypothetical protein
MNEQTKKRIEFYYLRESKPSTRFVQRHLESDGIFISYTAIARYIRQMPQAVKDFYRIGKGNWHDKDEPYEGQSKLIVRIGGSPGLPGQAR